MAVFALISFIALAVIAPSALAARSQVLFTDANGTLQTQWNVGDTLYLTVIAPDENRNSDQVEFIGTPDAAATVKDLLGNANPVVMIYDPDTKDMESSTPTGTALVLQETGPNTGIFRSQFGIKIVPCFMDTNGTCQGDSGNNSGQLAVINGDTIYARFQDPADATDVALDLAKIGSTHAKITLTDKAGLEIPLYHVGQQVFVTVEDPNANIDPTKADTITGVTLENPRCVEQAQGKARPDNPQPTPCGTPALVTLNLVETGPNTGVFRNVEGVTLVDTFGPAAGGPPGKSLFVNDKDTIAVFYRVPAPTPTAIATPAKRTDTISNDLITFSRTVTSPVQPGDTFTVTDTVTAKVALDIAAISDMLPAGFTLVSGTLTTLPQSDVSAGRSFTNTYQVRAGSVPGTFTISGTARAKPVGATSSTLGLDSPVTVGAGGPVTPPPSGGQTAENALLTFTRTAPATANAGDTITVTDTVTAKVDLQIVGVVDTLPAGFTLASGSLSSGLPTPLSAGQSKTFTYTVTVGSSSGTITGTAKGLPSGGSSQSVSLSSPISVSGGAAPPPPPSGGPPPPPPGMITAQGMEIVSNDLVHFTRTTPDSVQAGGTFTVTDTVQAKVDLELAAISDQLSANFSLISGNLTSFPKALKAGDTLTNSYTVRAASNANGTFAISGLTRAKRLGEPSKTLDLTNQVQITTGVPTIPQGAGAMNDNANFDLAQAKVGELNPATIQFTDIDGNPKTDFRIGDEFFVQVQMEDLNTSSDHAETICVQLYDVNGGREADKPCVEDHGRGLVINTTGVQLVETGINTGIFRNPDALKIIGICEDGIKSAEIAGTESKFSVPQVMAGAIPHAKDVNFPQAHARGPVLKECAPYTPYVQEALQEGAGKDVPGMIAVHTGDTVYAVFQDQLTDPHDLVYATAHIPTQETYDGKTNNIGFVDDKGNPVDTYKIGQDLFVKLTAPTRNINRDVVDKVEVMVVDLDTGDIENLVLTETGTDTGVFMNHNGLQLMPALSKNVVKREDGTLEVQDRDTIEVHYQDNFNPKDYTLAWIRMIPQPGGIGVTVSTPGTVKFTDANGMAVNSYAVGDKTYVQVQDKDRSGSNIGKSVVITNVRTQKTYTVAKLTETASGSGTFLSDAIATCATGGGCDLEVENGDQLVAKYTDPGDKSDTNTAMVTISSGVFEVKAFKNGPNPFTNTTTFMAVGSSIERVTVWVYDLSGALVFTNSSQGSKITWDGTNAAGEKLGNGVYLYILKAEGKGNSSTSDVRKLVLLK
jgi:hypothetical protein